MNKNREKFLQEILNAPSPSGFEQPAAEVFRKRVKGFADVVERDVHGNSYAILNPKAKFKFMLAGHIDEIGLMVNYIDENGYLYVGQIGGMDPALLVGQRVKILTAKGDVLGVVGRKAIHLMTAEERTKGVKMDNIWIDIGAADKKEAEKIIAIGDPMVIDVECRRLGTDKIIARGCDDKAGAFIVAEVIRELSKKKLNVSVIGVATVQEEVGLRGAITSSYNVNPDAGIAIDVGFTSDHPEVDKKLIGDIKVGAGPILHRGPNINPVLEAGLFKTAKTNKIPYQVSAEPRATGTDANAIQLSRGGAAAGLISMPNRYMHTPVEVVSLTDLENVIKLIVAYIEKLPAKKDYRP
ncbi:MAG: M42 family metallopeptidase [Phycisphaerae bacterium]|nr:M42 family metallopeptidase [Phycisphaerae bacterium]